MLIIILFEKVEKNQESGISKRLFERQDRRKKYHSLNILFLVTDSHLATLVVCHVTKVKVYYAIFMRSKNVF